ncbi:MAG: type I 3-dehydroquinate dehydratase [Chloroflexi bacterium]|nr:type I 3-dehydroquinate dehydratase [Chloroflexota bacterium]MCY3938780.1 type I 3-dehydroquinate dehydratase [Chloroflexota bacterium]
MQFRPAMKSGKRMRMIAIALAAETTEATLRAFDEAAGRVDAIELRLDLMREFDLRRLIEARPCPVVVTNRPVREGGKFTGSERDRTRHLHDAIDLGAEYVDIEEDAVGMLGGVSPTRLIVSHHDFSTMPEDLDSLRRRLEERGTGAIKVAGMAARPEDALTALGLYESTPLPAISIAMGEHGVASRILALRHANCLLTYCALDTGGIVAPGQISVGAIRDVYRAESIGGTTKAVGVASQDPISDSLMADVNAGLRETGIDAVAVPMRIAPPDEARLVALAEGGYDGFWLMDGMVGMEAAVFASFSEGTLKTTPAAELDDALSATALHLG